MLAGRAFWNALFKREGAAGRVHFDLQRAGQQGFSAAFAFGAAHKVHVAHSSLKAGDLCPECQRGKVYLQREPGVLVRLIGRAPIEATV